MNIVESLIKKLGARYMPPNAIHWSDLPEERRAQILAKAPDIAGKHGDWWLLKIPRAWTTWWAPFPPRKIKGNAREVEFIAEDGTVHWYCKPIPEKGEWFQTAGRTPGVVGYRASTSEGGNINRWGARYDDLAGYITWPAIRAGSLTDFLKKLVN